MRVVTIMAARGGSNPSLTTKIFYMENTTEERLPLSTHWEINLKEFNLSHEIIDRIEQLRYNDGIMMKKYMDEANEWRVKYFTLQRHLRDLL
jgi:hypothetical protein